MSNDIRVDSQGRIEVMARKGTRYFARYDSSSREILVLSREQAQTHLSRKENETLREYYIREREFFRKLYEAQVKEQTLTLPKIILEEAEIIPGKTLLEVSSSSQHLTLRKKQN
jgi:hypothetical protein